MKISYEEARARALRYVQGLNDSGPESEVELVLIDEDTERFERGWMFFYQSKAYCDSGDFRDFVPGTAPIIIDDISGTLHETGTEREPEYYLAEYLKRPGEIPGDTK